MLTYPHIDPVALQLGPLAIHWYGITYLVAFGLFMFLGTRRLRHEPFASITGPSAWTRKDVEDILFLGVVGVSLAGGWGTACSTSPATTSPTRWRFLRCGRAAWRSTVACWG